MGELGWCTATALFIGAQRLVKGLGWCLRRYTESTRFFRIYQEWNKAPGIFWREFRIL